MNSNSKNSVQFWINTEIHTQTQHSQYVERKRERGNLEKRKSDSSYIYIRGLSIIEQLIFYQKQWWPKAVVRHIQDPEGREWGTINHLSTVFQK